jgi:hypothetical protein
MNTFYYVDDNEIKTIETVKDFSFIQSLSRYKNAAESIDGIAIPYGHKLDGMKFVETEEYKKDQAISKIKSELAELDNSIPRGLEDFMSTVAYDDSKFPAVFAEKLQAKKDKREELGMVEHG